MCFPLSYLIVAWEAIPFDKKNNWIFENCRRKRHDVSVEELSIQFLGKQISIARVATGFYFPAMWVMYFSGILTDKDYTVKAKQ